MDEIMAANAQKLSENFGEQLNAFLNFFTNLKEKKDGESAAIKRNMESIIETALEEIAITCWDIEAKVEGSK